VTLKQALDDPHSQLRAFLAARLPNVKAVRARWRHQQPLATQVITPAVDTIAATSGAAISRRYPYDEVGHAISLRLALLFSPNIPNMRVPIQHPLVGQPWPAAEACKLKLDTTLLQAFGAGVLPADEERQLLRTCYLAGLFDQYYRIGPYPDLPLLQVRPDVTFEELIDSLVAEVCIDDLIALLDAARPALVTLTSDPDRVVVGPTFTGSVDVGGADADLLIDGTLLEIKSRLKNELQQRHLYQLATYALLDYDDAYHIRHLAMYSARHASLIRWPLSDVVEWLAGAPANVARLRHDLRTHLTSPRN
jgi:hypothetical protein